MRYDAAQISHLYTLRALSRHTSKSRSVIDSNFRIGGYAYAGLLVDGWTWRQRTKDEDYFKVDHNVIELLVD